MVGSSSSRCNNNSTTSTDKNDIKKHLHFPKNCESFHPKNVLRNASICITLPPMIIYEMPITVALSWIAVQDVVM